MRRFAAERRVDAVQIELNERCYLDLTRRRYPHRPRLGDFEPTQRRCAASWPTGSSGR